MELSKLIYTTYLSLDEASVVCLAPSTTGYDASSGAQLLSKQPTTPGSLTL